MITAKGQFVQITKIFSHLSLVPSSHAGFEISISWVSTPIQWMWMECILWCSHYWKDRDNDSVTQNNLQITLPRVFKETTWYSRNLYEKQKFQCCEHQLLYNLHFHCIKGVAKNLKLILQNHQNHLYVRYN